MSKVIALTLVYNTPDLAEEMRRQIPEVRVIDNGSHAPMQQSWLRIPVNRYWSGGFNRAMEALYSEGKYEWAWLLNSDVSLVSTAMMESLLATAEEHGVPMISPGVPSSTHTEMHPTRYRETHYIDCVAPLINVDWFISNGGFDERLCGWGSDIDLCYRTRYDCKAVDGTFQIQHPFGVTAKRMNDRAMYQLQDTRQYLLAKHGPEITRFLPAYF
jgi:hypothetical protein